MASAETKHVQNVSGVEQTIVGFGVIAPDAVIEVPVDFNNANFETLPMMTREEAKAKGIDVEKVEREAGGRTPKAPKK